MVVSKVAQEGLVVVHDDDQNDVLTEDETKVGRDGHEGVLDVGVVSCGLVVVDVDVHLSRETIPVNKWI